MLSQALQTALNNAETKLAAAQSAEQAKTASKNTLDQATKADGDNATALTSAYADLANARKAVIDAATAEFTLPAADGSGNASPTLAAGNGA